MPESICLTVGEVLQIHHQLINNYGGTHGVRDKGLLESVVFRPQIRYYNNIAEEAAAALMESLANNHPFLDGNKRVAFAAAHAFLLVNGHDLEADPLASCDFMMQSIATRKLPLRPLLTW